MKSLLNFEEDSMLDDMEVHNMFATPDSKKELMDYIGSLNEPTHYITAMMMWNLIASGNHKEK